jgi:hypothetical protein
MVPLTHVSKPPRVNLRLWLLLLLAPVSWSTAFGVLFSLVDETCTTGSRVAPGWVAGTCLVLAALPGLMAWPWRRSANLATPSGERTRFMLEIAIGASLLFTLVMIVTTVPIAFLDPCRT